MAKNSYKFTITDSFNLPEEEILEMAREILKEEIELYQLSPSFKGPFLLKTEIEEGDPSKKSYHFESRSNELDDSLKDDPLSIEKGAPHSMDDKVASPSDSIAIS